MPNITNKQCRKAVTARSKIYDAECSGLYVSLSPTAPPTFSLKYTCPITKERLTHWLGVYQEPERGVDYWRKEAWKLKVKINAGEDIAQSARQARKLQAKRSGITVDQIIDERIAWISELAPIRRSHLR
ncbi:Arm DNA-binding domain-containing protein [Bradyrhizobium sp. 2S1]|uniref:Arm DNA-binding domain-containing protein n=1 Tax=Bradyrhizobium sp. 2S1 TaxID=1404429 RepID=UPI00140B9C87|nr:Arm DNA-binding domain-containing protein [Bradyrhizobium sp. 2S1]MCK7672195.1 Arm DNA-binding domain-containing protein [Bradyrhizobium sp. 2S1]